MHHRCECECEWLFIMRTFPQARTYTAKKTQCLRNCATNAVFSISLLQNDINGREITQITESKWRNKKTQIDLLMPDEK